MFYSADTEKENSVSFNTYAHKTTKIPMNPFINSALHEANGE